MDTTEHRGFHFYTLNLEKAVAQILERCDLIPASPTPTPDASPVERDHDLEKAPIDEETEGFIVVPDADQKRRRRSSAQANSQPGNRVVVSRERATETSKTHTAVFEAPDDEAGVPKEKLNSRANTLAISEGRGALDGKPYGTTFPMADGETHDHPRMVKLTAMAQVFT